MSLIRRSRVYFSLFFLCLLQSQRQFSCELPGQAEYVPVQEVYNISEASLYNVVEG